MCRFRASIALNRNGTIHGFYRCTLHIMKCMYYMIDDAIHTYRFWWEGPNQEYREEDLEFVVQLCPDRAHGSFRVTSNAKTA